MPESVYEDHPSFPQPGADAKIWRYCDLQKFISVLHRRALYFSRLSTLEDPYEAKWPKSMAIRFPDFSQSNFDRTRHQVFASCWHINEFESAAMWQLYSRMDEGVAIRSSLRSLKAGLVGFDPVPPDIITPGVPPKVFIGKVSYLDYENDAFDWSNMLTAAIHKRRSFEHERELRAVCWLSSNYLEWIPNPGPYHSGIFVNCDLDTLIEEVVISPTAPAVFVEAVRAVCGKFGVIRPIVQSDLNTSPVY